jgi:hypothetical protein
MSYGITADNAMATVEALALRTMAEQGSPAVSMGTYLRILAALHLQDDIGLLAADDKLGRRLQDIELDSRKNA